MLRRLFGWAESPEPVARPMAPAAQPAAEASGEEEGEEAQLVAHPVAPARTAVKRSRDDVDGDGEARARGMVGRTSNRRWQVGSDGQQRRCLFTVLDERKRGRAPVPCVPNCAGLRCLKEAGHVCSTSCGGLDGRELVGEFRVRSDRLAAVDIPYARAIRRCWRREWGPKMSEKELITHGLCRHAELAVGKHLVDDDYEGLDTSPTATDTSLVSDEQARHTLCASS